MSDFKQLSFEDPYSQAIVIPADNSEGSWQPQPANGHADVILSQP